MPCAWTPAEAAAWNNHCRAVTLFNYVAEKMDIAERFDEREYGIRSDKIYEKLCGLIRSLDENSRDRIIYNARDPIARNLADWWEYEQARDKRRLDQETREKRDRELREQAATKLTPEERRALGLK